MTQKLSESQIAALKKPLAPEAIKPHPTKTYLSTIKAIYVIERFNEVFGLGGWHIANEVVEAGEKHIVVKSSFHAPEYGINVVDIFGGNDNPDRGDAYKGACTDALTKIGSYLYVGMDVFKGLGDKSNGEEKKEKAWLNKGTAEFAKAIGFLAGGGLIGNIEKKYKISKENKALLIEEAANKETSQTK